ncbi:pseudouridine synthase [Streptomonospora wellingtoniae]|uniref:Pseudouridine synthase n=1 Tax=Streptomonospora wellingtoniae TaxID=3075544 RepID=A0ABU2KVW6_9ACTN|nr:pseudouridine synthase [Streptomonospora sp. DSM 45055]MDT0303439.1 pseudouridine synthase [Streptomonospora sp. DSM 45055]
MNTPRKNSRSRGVRDSDDRRAERGRSAPRGERGGDQRNPDNRSRSDKAGKPENGGRRDSGSAPRGQGQAAGRGGAARGGSDERRGRQSDARPGRQQHGGANHRDPVLRNEAERAQRSGARAEKSGTGRGARDSRDSRDSRESRGSNRGERRDPRVYTRREERGGGRSANDRPAPRDSRDSGVPRGGGAAERDLSPAARARLNTLRSEFDPADEESAGDDRDAYADVPGGIRLQKALAQAGVASRRASEELIVAGRVSVDGHTVRRFGARVDPDNSEIRVDGMRVVVSPDKLYYALHKPRGVVSTMADPEGRPTLADYTGGTEERLFHVGRLDTETEGLILLTNDGELANRLTHPRYQVVKTYVAKVPGPVPREVIRGVRAGVELEDGPVEVDSFRVVENGEPQALVEVRLHEGRKHIVRRLMEAVGHPVYDLARTQVGPVGIKTLKAGTMRALTAEEVSELYTTAGL